MKKNVITIREFIDKSIGEWKSIRSTHSLAFQEFENTHTNLKISYLNLKTKEVENIITKFSFEYKSKFALKIEWESTSEWSDKDESQINQTILIFAPIDDYSGLILKNKGYAELIQSHSTYLVDIDGYLNINTEYNSTISDEKIWFLSENVRSRYSVIKNRQNKSVIQTSHATEIRKIIT